MIKNNNTTRKVPFAAVFIFLMLSVFVTANTLAQTVDDAMNNLPTSLHGTRAGKAFWYNQDGSHPEFTGQGYGQITGVPYDDLTCATCHDANNPDATSCAMCHSGAFPDQVPNTTCLGCHGRQVAEQTKGFTDVHSTAYPNCVDCHTWNEMHGTGTAYNSMFEEGARETTCEGCHMGDSPEGPEVLPTVSHDVHGGKVHCTACHDKSVVTCYNCHFDSAVNHVGKFAHTVFGENDKNNGWIMLVNYKGQVHAGSYLSAVYEGGNTFVAFGAYHGHSVAGIGEARVCNDCHKNDAMTQLNSNNKIVLTTWDNSTDMIVQETVGAIPLVDGKLEMAWTDLVTLEPKTWRSIGNETEHVQYGFVTPLTSSQLNSLSCSPDGECEMCFGDCDNDSNVGFSDLVLMKTQYGMTDCLECTADLDGDEVVGFGDLVKMKLNYGKFHCCPH